MNVHQMKTKSISKRAFTLIEIMVATVIMVVLVGLVIQITSEVLKVWTRSSGKLAANAEARIAMDLITQDLETTVFRNNEQQWLRVDGPEALATDAPYGSKTVALKLFSPALDRDKFEADGITAIPGDICAVAYRLEYQTSYDQTGLTDPLKVYALYRAIERPDNTFNNLMGSSSQASSPQLILDDSSHTFWSTASIIDPKNYLVSNIVDFKVLIYEDDPANTVPVPMNADASFVLDDNYIYGGTGATLTGSGGTTQLKLLYADVMLTVVSDEGLEILQNMADGRAGGEYVKTIDGLSAEEQVVQQHGEVFTRRVNFMAHPL
jgi:prepilin-type N-terminal cleavage/methylation domain-containing protein